MSTYSKNYTKLTNGYIKIMDTIDSVKKYEHLICISNMINSWVNLIDLYCDEVYDDKTNKERKKDAISLAKAGKEMFDDIKDFFQYKNDYFQPTEYTGINRCTRIKPLSELIYE